MNYYGKEREPLKANLHTHTVNSDGRFTAAEVIKLYADEGYDVLAFTDHRVSNPVSTYDSMGMTLISGMEVHPQGPRGIPWHLLALGTPEDFQHLEEWKNGEDAATAILEAGGIYFLAHPYWCGFTSDELLTLKKSACGIEVYNSSTKYIGKGYSMQSWDECLDQGAEFTAIAVDDIHGLGQAFCGYTMILAEENSQEAIIKALKNGDFYASQGPEFYSLNFENGVFEAEFSPCTEAILLTNKSRGFCAAIEDGKKAETPIKSCSSMKFDISQLPKNSYVRCQIKDKDGRYAWSNPLFL